MPDNTHDQSHRKKELQQLWSKNLVSFYGSAHDDLQYITMTILGCNRPTAGLIN